MFTTARHARALVIWLLLSTGSIALLYPEGLPFATAFVLLAPSLLVAFPTAARRWWVPVLGSAALLLGLFSLGDDPLGRSAAIAGAAAVTVWLSRRTALTLGRRAAGAAVNDPGIPEPEVGIYAVLEKELARGRRHQREFAVLSMDRGDRQQPVADGLPAKLRENLYRYASVHPLTDRVLAVVPEVNQQDVEGLRLRLQTADLADGGLRIGAAVFPHEGLTADGLISAADDARRRARSTPAEVLRTSVDEPLEQRTSKTA